MAAWSLPEPTVFPPRSLDGDEPTAAPKGKELFKGYIRVNERRTQLEGRDVVDWHVAGVTGPPPHAVVRGRRSEPA